MCSYFWSNSNLFRKIRNAKFFGCNIVQMVVYCPLILLCSLSETWLPLIETKQDSPWLTRVIIKGRVYSGEYICQFSVEMWSCLRCLLFSEPYSPPSLSFVCYAFVPAPLLVVYLQKTMNYFLCRNSNMKDYPIFEEGYCTCTDSIVFVMFVIMYINLQMLITLVCRPSAVIFDYRFISTLGVQLTGLFGCLVMACILGMMFPIVTPLESPEQSPANK